MLTETTEIALAIIAIGGAGGAVWAFAGWLQDHLRPRPVRRGGVLWFDGRPDPEVGRGPICPACYEGPEEVRSPLDRVSRRTRRDPAQLASLYGTGPKVAEEGTPIYEYRCRRCKEYFPIEEDAT